jgi:Fic family protein
MPHPLKLLSPKYLHEYEAGLDMDWREAYKQLYLKEGFTAEDFEFYLITASVESARIEGNTLTLDDYLRNTQFNITSKPREMAEINDLLAAYHFAVNNRLTKKHFLQVHQLSSPTILPMVEQQGKLRQTNVGIFGNGRLIYMAIDHKDLPAEFDKLFADIQTLLKQDLPYQEVFYYAAMIHLVFEKIHPFADGNGRTGRLLEKWFLAEKIGTAAWSIPSEKYYMAHRPDYYKALGIGLDYYSINLDLCLPFLWLLPKVLG